MSNADEVFLTDAINGIEVSPFAEPATFKPRVGTPRQIIVEVVRNPPATPDELSRGLAPSMTITAVNSSTYGIAATELNRGGDRINIAENIGETAKDILLTTPAVQDSSYLVFRIGKQ